MGLNVAMQNVLRVGKTQRGQDIRTVPPIEPFPGWLGMLCNVVRQIKVAPLESEIVASALRIASYVD